MQAAIASVGDGCATVRVEYETLTLQCDLCAAHGWL